jgi:hypothetical protein
LAGCDARNPAAHRGKPQAWEHSRHGPFD